MISGCVKCVSVFLLYCMRDQSIGRVQNLLWWRLPDVCCLPNFKQLQNFHHIFRAQLPSLPPQPTFPLPSPSLGFACSCECSLFLWIAGTGFCWLRTFIYVQIFCTGVSINAGQWTAGFLKNLPEASERGRNNLGFEIWLKYMCNSWIQSSWVLIMNWHVFQILVISVFLWDVC